MELFNARALPESSTPEQHLRDYNRKLSVLQRLLALLARVGLGLRVRAAFVELEEVDSEPAEPAAGLARLYLIDNGAGKLQLRVRFPTGAAQTVATEP